ncbi:hypothetical protein N9245_00435 [bacterium]|nr:hypothetical protein [bacterium]
MTEQVDTAVQPDIVEPVTDSAEPVELNKSETMTQPEFKDGKWYLEGKRFYARDEVNQVSARAKSDAVSSILKDLDVDSIDQVKDVISTLKSAELTEEGQSSLDVKALKQAVAKREATVDELTAEVNNLRKDLVLKDHLGALQSHMPSAWNIDQRQAVLDLMNARNMFAVENNTFALKNGDDYLTTDGVKPDYESAISMVGKGLGLPFGKKGVDVVNAQESTNDDSGRSPRALQEDRLLSDPEYRAAYTTVRNSNMNYSRADVNHTMVMKQVDKARKARQG